MAEHEDAKGKSASAQDAEASLDAWLQALHDAPRPTWLGASDIEDWQEAQQLGRAYRKQAAAAQEPRLPAPATRQAALLARASARGLLKPKQAVGQAWWQAWLRPWGALPLTASALLLLLLLVWPEAPQGPGDMPGDNTATEVWRGAEHIHELRSAQPRQARDEAQRRLTAAGLTSGPFEQPGAFGLEVEVPATPDPAMQTALRHVFERLPPAGSHRLLYRDSEPDAISGASATSATKPAQ